MESGLIVQTDHPSEMDRLISLLEESDFYFEVGDNHIFFPEEPSAYDALEDDLKSFIENVGIDVTFEGV